MGLTPTPMAPEEREARMEDAEDDTDETGGVTVNQGQTFVVQDDEDDDEDEEDA